MKQQQDVLAMDTFDSGKDWTTHLEHSLVLATEEATMAETMCSIFFFHVSVSS